MQEAQVHGDLIREEPFSSLIWAPPSPSIIWAPSPSSLIRDLTWSDLGRLPYLNAVIKESLRLRPPAAQGTFRETSKATRVRGGEGGREGGIAN